jgi:energy-converting hydrogenase Eha subunit E
MVATTVCVVVLMTKTVSEDSFTTYANCPFGVMATKCGPAPTVTVATVVGVSPVVTTDTVPLPLFATYNNVLSGVTAIPVGVVPTVKVVVCVLRVGEAGSVSILPSEFVPNV